MKKSFEKETCLNICLANSRFRHSWWQRCLDNAIPVVSAYPAYYYTMSTVESDLSMNEATGGVETRQRLKRNEVRLRRQRNEAREKCKNLEFELRKLQERLTVVNTKDGEAKQAERTSFVCLSHSV